MHAGDVSKTRLASSSTRSTQSLTYHTVRFLPPSPSLLPPPTIRADAWMHNADEEKWDHQPCTSSGAQLTRSAEQPAHPGPPALALACECSRSRRSRVGRGGAGPEDTFRMTECHQRPIPERVCLGVQRKTLRRLPRSGVVVFTIRVYLTSGRTRAWSSGARPYGT
ncbi:hypothetical protein BJY52DRAFT_569570 [Lactarius psammicola]|nr:hypothetical protein BJY52DRAFT_569570 [Lactarius psammicola]